MARSVTRQPVVRVYHGVSFEPLGEWAGIGSVSIAYDEHGPASADITLPRDSVYLRADAIAPGGMGVVIEIDARDLGTDVNGSAIGVPDVWLGRVQTLPASSRGATCTVALGGPSTWLERITVARQAVSTEPAGSIARRLIEQYPIGRVSPGPVTYRGPGGEMGVGGQSLWSALASMADDRGETFTLTALPGEARLLLDWRHPLQSEDRTASVVLIEGTNIEWDTTFQLDATASDLLGVAESFAAGPSAVAAMVSAPSAARFGRLAALSATLGSSAARAVVEGGEAIIRPDIPTRAELELVLGAALRQLLVPPILLQATVTDPAIWRHLTPGALVTTYIHDPLQLFAGGAVARVLDRAYDVWPTLACTVGLELWKVSDESTY